METGETSRREKETDHWRWGLVAVEEKRGGKFRGMRSLRDGGRV